MKNKFFYNSYAIISYINGNEAYKKYFVFYEGFTTLYNVMEVYYIVFREEGEKKAKTVINFLKSMIIYPVIDDVEGSMKFRFKHKEKKFSYADCLGYFLAEKNNIKFLTGDESFRYFKNVEFVK